MSYAPQPLLDARAYLRRHTGLPDAALGIVGDSAHRSGYHLGADRLGPDDYSARTARDRAGLTDAASALDVGAFARLRQLTAHMVTQARAGHLPDVRELIGPWSDGRAYRWDHLASWAPVRRAAGDSHEWHLHISYYRDSERRSKIGPFRDFFEPQEDDMQLSDRVSLIHGGKRLWAGRLMGRDDMSVEEALMWGLGVGPHIELLPSIAQLRGQVDGLAALVRELAAAPPVPVTPEQLAALTTAVEQAATAGAANVADVVERISLTVDPVDGEPEPGAPAGTES